MRVSKYFGQTVSLVVLLASPLFADDKGAADDLPVTPEAVLAAQQLQLATKLSRIRDLFDDLRQFEEDVNPRRAKLLKQARKTSDEPHNSMTEVVINLSRQDLRKALVGQKFTIEKLEELLALLKQEDRGERIKTERQRIKEYIKEIERLQRIQRALRGQNESGAEADRLAKGQEGVANRTKDLDSRIKQDESAGVVI
jgi:hypothetical protein